MKGNLKYHLLAFITIIFWGFAYIPTKVLLIQGMGSLEIVLFRFLIAMIILQVLFPKWGGFKDRKRELYIFIAGLTGIFLYYALENTALMYTTTANVGILAALIPLFTMIVTAIIERKNFFHRNSIIGGLLALVGTGFVMLNGKLTIINPLGDVLALIASLVFAIYTFVLHQIDYKGEPFVVLKKKFAYGLLGLFVFMGVERTSIHFQSLNIYTIAIILFLAIVPTLICFSMWTVASKRIGAVATSNYIYLAPVVTVLSSSVFLAEQIQVRTIIGMILVIGGLYLSNKDAVQS